MLLQDAQRIQVTCALGAFARRDPLAQFKNDLGKLLFHRHAKAENCANTGLPYMMPSHCQSPCRQDIPGPDERL